MKERDQSTPFPSIHSGSLPTVSAFQPFLEMAIKSFQFARRGFRWVESSAVVSFLKVDIDLMNTFAEAITAFLSICWWAF